MRHILFILLLSFPLAIQAQDTIIIDGSKINLNRSIANKFTIYEGSKSASCESFLFSKERFQGRKLVHSIENLDFTTSAFFIHFVLSNHTANNEAFFLETGRPITNGIELYETRSQSSMHSGDGIDFRDKVIATNRSVIPIAAPAGQETEYVLKLSSDGEIISLPIVFWDQNEFQISEQRNQFIFGIFYGIFLFVIVIYLTFYFMLKDRLFLFYSFYVAFSGLMQFALDGYVHQYIFTSGGYMTQHSVILISGATVFFAFMYATEYLQLEGRMRKVSMGLSGLVVLGMLLSLIPGIIYELSYPIINGFSLLTLIFLIIVGANARKRNPSISILFLVGLFILLAGGVLFILGNFSVIDSPGLTQNALKFGTLAEILCLSILMAGKYKSLQDEKEAAQKQLLRELEEKNKLAAETNIRLEKEVQARTQEIEAQRAELKEKNDDLISSIKYAKRIQNAILPHDQKFKDLIPNSFVLYRPKDIVSGDFYWVESIDPTRNWPNGLTVYATADCTGHGVPGAFVSIVCSNLLKLGKSHKDVQSTGQALDFVNREINDALNSSYSDEEIRDGMDIALCAFDKTTSKLFFSGAKNGVLIIRNNEILEYKGDRMAIGNSGHESDHEFTTHEIDLQHGDMIYTYTDGIIDQFGGPKQKKFLMRRFKETLLAIHSHPFSQQKELLNKAFEDWKGGEEQIDDVLVIGVQVN
jgi:serine phosphatase RsbU (regulator of sigma subunit)